MGLKMLPVLTVPGQPSGVFPPLLLAQDPMSAPGTTRLCSSNATGGSISSSSQPCLAWPWGLLNQVQFWPISIPMALCGHAGAVPNLGFFCWAWSWPHPPSLSGFGLSPPPGMHPMLGARAVSGCLLSALLLAAGGGMGPPHWRCLSCWPPGKSLRLLAPSLAELPAIAASWQSNPSTASTQDCSTSFLLFLL